MSDRGNPGRRDGGKKYSSLNLNQTYRGNRHDTRPSPVTYAPHRATSGLQSLGKVRNRPTHRGSAPDAISLDSDVKDIEEGDLDCDLAHSPALADVSKATMSLPPRSHFTNDKNDDDDGWAGNQEEVDFNAKLTWGDDDEPSLQPAEFVRTEEAATAPSSIAQEEAPPAQVTENTSSTSGPQPSQEISACPAAFPAADRAPLEQSGGRRLPSGSVAGRDNRKPPFNNRPQSMEYSQRGAEQAQRRHSFRDTERGRGTVAPSPADEDRNWRVQPPGAGPQARRPASYSNARRSSHGPDSQPLAGSQPVLGIGSDSRDAVGGGYGGRDGRNIAPSSLGARDVPDRYPGHGSHGVRGTTDHDQDAQNVTDPQRSGGAPPAPAPPAAAPVRIMQRDKSGDSATNEVAESPPSSSQVAAPSSDNGRGAGGKRTLYNHHSGEFEADKGREAKKVTAAGAPEKRVQRAVLKRDESAQSGNKDSTDSQEQQASGESHSKPNRGRRHDAYLQPLASSSSHDAGLRGDHRKDQFDKHHSSPVGDRPRGDKNSQTEEAFSKSDSSRRSRRQSKDRSETAPSTRSGASRDETAGHGRQSPSSPTTSQPQSGKGADGSSSSHRTRKRLESHESGPPSPMSLGTKAPNLGKAKSESSARRTDHDRFHSKSASSSVSSGAVSGHAHSEHTGADTAHHDRHDKATFKSGNGHRRQDTPDSESPTGEQRHGQQRHGRHDRRQHQQHGEESRRRGSADFGPRAGDDSHRSGGGGGGDGNRRGGGDDRHRSAHENRRPGDGGRGFSEDGRRSSKESQRGGNVGPRLRNNDDSRQRGADGGSSKSHRNDSASSARSMDGDQARRSSSTTDDARRSGTSRSGHSGNDSRRSGKDGSRSSASSSHKEHDRPSARAPEKSRIGRAAIEHHLESGQHSKDKKKNNSRRSSTAESTGHLVVSSIDVANKAPDNASKSLQRSVGPEVRHIVEHGGVPHESVISLKAVEADLPPLMGPRPASPALPAHQPSQPPSVSSGVPLSVSKPEQLQLSSTDNSEEYNTPPSSFDSDTTEGKDLGTKIVVPTTKDWPTKDCSSAPVSVDSDHGTPTQSVRRYTAHELPKVPRKATGQKESSSKSVSGRRPVSDRSSPVNPGSRSGGGKHGHSGNKRNPIEGVDLNSSRVCVVDDLPDPSSNTPLVDSDFCMLSDNIAPDPEAEFQVVVSRGRRKELRKGMAASSSDKPGKSSNSSATKNSFGKVSVRDASANGSSGVRKTEKLPKLKHVEEVQEPGPGIAGNSGSLTISISRLNESSDHSQPEVVRTVSYEASSRVTQATSDSVTAEASHADRASATNSTGVAPAGKEASSIESPPSEVSTSGVVVAVQSTAAVTANSITSQDTDERVTQCSPLSATNTTTTNSTGLRSSPSHTSPGVKRRSRGNSPVTLDQSQPGLVSEAQHTAVAYPHAQVQMQHVPKRPLLGNSPTAAMHQQGHFPGAQQPMVTMHGEPMHLVQMPLRGQDHGKGPVYQPVQPLPQHVRPPSPALGQHVQPVRPQALQPAPQAALITEQAQRHQQQHQQQQQYPTSTSPALATSPKYSRGSQASPLLHRPPPVQLIGSQSSQPSPPPPAKTSVPFTTPQALGGQTVSVVVPHTQPQLVAVAPMQQQHQQHQHQQQLQHQHHQQQVITQAQQIRHPQFVAAGAVPQVAYQPMQHRRPASGQGDVYRHPSPGMVLSSPAVRQAMPVQGHPAKAATMQVIVPAQQGHLAYAQHSPQLQHSFAVANAADLHRHPVGPSIVRLPHAHVPPQQQQQHPHAQQIGGAANATFPTHVPAVSYGHTPQMRMQAPMPAGMAAPSGQMSQIAAVPHSVALVPAAGGEVYATGQVQQQPRHLVAGPAYGVVRCQQPQQSHQPVQHFHSQPIRPGMPAQVIVNPPYSVVAQEHIPPDASRHNAKHSRPRHSSPQVSRRDRRRATQSPETSSLSAPVTSAATARVSSPPSSSADAPASQDTATDTAKET